MNFLSSLDAKDRKLLLWCVGIALGLSVVMAFLPQQRQRQSSAIELSGRTAWRARRLRDAAALRLSDRALGAAAE